MYWRRFAVSSIPIDNPAAFEVWLLNRWYEKDNLLEYFHRNGCFPADTGVDITPSGKTRRGAGYVETEIKAFRWYEFMQIFAPIGLFALVLYSFYGSLPGNVMKSIVDKVGAAEEEQVRVQQQQKKLLTAPPRLASSIASKKVAATPKPPTKKPPAKKAPVRQAPSKTTAPPKAIATAPSTKPTTATPAKKAPPKPKPAAAPNPPKLEIKRAVPTPAKKPAVKPAVKPAAPKKTDPKKPAATKAADTQSQTSQAPKKLAPKPKPAAVQKAKPLVVKKS